MNRRQLLTKAAAAMSISYSVPSSVPGRAERVDANEHLTIGMIGVGGMGTGHFRHMIKFRDDGSRQLTITLPQPVYRLMDVL